MDELLSFFKSIGEMKEIKRSGWEFAEIESPESIADHSYRVIVLAMIFGDKFNLNVEKIMKIALLHDICEIESGDLTPLDDIEENEKQRIENEGFEIIINKINDSITNEYVELWKEYREGKTPEAKLVKQLDKFEMLLQASEYENRGYDPKIFEKFWISGIKEINEPIILNLLKKLNPRN